MLRNGDKVNAKISNWEDSTITRRLKAVIDASSMVSKISKNVWEELGVKSLFNHWQSHKPAGLVRFDLHGHEATDNVIVTRGRPILSLPLLTSMGYRIDQSGALHWDEPLLALETGGAGLVGPWPIEGVGK